MHFSAITEMKKRRIWLCL